jgi:hypothetical protein
MSTIALNVAISGLIDLMERKDQSQNDVQNVKSVIGMTKRKG